MLVACAGHLAMNGYSNGSMIATLFGAAVAFNLLGKLLYIAYGFASGSMTNAKKSSDSFALFKGTVMKNILLALTYIYAGLGVFYTFHQAYYIAMSTFATAFIAAIVIDILVIDTTIGMITSLFGAKADRHVVGNVSPN